MFEGNNSRLSICLTNTHHSQIEKRMTERTKFH